MRASLMNVENTCLISALVGEVQLCLLRAEVHARFLAHHLGVDCFIGLHTDHQLIAATLISKNVTRDICELQPNFGLPLV